MSAAPEAVTMETSNFAHVVFQHVAQSYAPHTPLECRYTLTHFITPHPKDWVGIFKVGWSTARDYYTFLWSPMPDGHTEGTSINRIVVFQGYYVPSDDGEFYQFCYVSHRGEIRGASTPFLFRANSPPHDEILAIEDDTHSDILVVTTKASILEEKLSSMERELEGVKEEKQHLEVAVETLTQERDALTHTLAQERDTHTHTLEEEREAHTHTLQQEQQACTQLRTQLQEATEEREEVRRRQEDLSSRLLQLEEDLIGTTQRALQKETQIDSLKDRIKKLSQEKENLESQLKNERDEKELYKVHLKSRELENTKLGAELQMVKGVEVTRENTIAQLTGEVCVLREQLRQKGEELEACRQGAAMLRAELRDAASVRDRSMAQLYAARLENDTLRQNTHTNTQDTTQDTHTPTHTHTHTNTTQQEEDAKTLGQQEAEELQREVEDLRVRLQMAAEHYKDKYKECQKLHKQVAKLTGEAKGSPEAGATPLTSSPEPSVPGSGVAGTGSDATLENLLNSKLKNDKSDKYKKIRQMLSEEKERSGVYVCELSKLEQRFREQLKTNETLRLQMAAEEDRYRSQVAEKGRELKELKDKLAALQKGKDLQRGVSGEQEGEEPGQEEAGLVFQEGEELQLQYPLPYQEPASLMTSHLEYGNPYTPDGDGDDLSDELLPRLPPMGPPSWDSNVGVASPGGVASWEPDVVISQPARNASRPDGLEEEEPNTQPIASEDPAPPQPPPAQITDTHTPFCFEASEQKRCPLCEVIFPPQYEQRRFEEHVESHWKVCPMCAQQFPLHVDQQIFEKHVLTHFDGNVLNFE
ncbi:tax1-binding protein 1 homolog B [Engraulis encrasicolus]|uniref:tax1-binding protein 1 homolog B n=1 Tax=Engraulis encrasicolus TaxID=184585 RepID=UPI002FCF87C5